MSTSPMLLDATLANHHDYVWARLPFVVPMAIASARHRTDRAARELAHLVVELQPLLLGHLDREEALLAHRAKERVVKSVREWIDEDHAAILALIERIRTVAGEDYHPPTDADSTERVLYLSFARIDAHVQAQIAIEEQLITVRDGTLGASS